MPIRNVILNLFWLSCFFPFISPVVINSDLQPINLLLTLLLYVGVKIKDNSFRFDELMIIGFMFFFLLYLNPNGDMSKLNISKYLTFSLALFIPLLLNCREFVVSKVVYKWSLYIYFSCSLLSFIEPELMFGVQSNFINVRNEFVLGGRGISPLSPEPSFFAAVIFGMMFINEHLLENKYISRERFVFYLTLMMAMMIMNRSGSAIIYSLFYFSLTGRLGVLKYIGFASIIPMAIWYLAKASEASRALDLINLFLSGDYFLSGDVSFSNRIADYTSGFISLLQSPFGVTPIMVSDNLSRIGFDFNIYKFMYNEINGVTSSISYGLMSYGLFFVLWIVYIFNMVRSKLKYKLASFLLMSFSVSYAFPLIWVLMMLGKRENE